MRISLISTSTYPSDQGLRTISSSLKNNNHKVKLIFLPENENYNKKYSTKVLKQLSKLVVDSNLIGISSYASTSIRARQIINYLKNLNIPIIYGGIHATISPNLCIQDADLVLIGEGEESIVELANNLEKNKDITKIKNLWIKKFGKLYKNELHPLIQNLDSLPFPDYELENHYILEKNKIIKFKERHLNGQIFFLTGRGCPHACTYCSNAFLDNLYQGKNKFIRFHSNDYIINCLFYLKTKFKSLKFFDFRDDVFFMRTKEQLRDFCIKYKQKINMRFKALIDPHTADEEKISMLVNAGCTDIIVGIQGSEKTNKEIYKRYQTDEQVLKSAYILNKYKNKLTVMYDIITCNPYERPEDIINQIRLLQRIPKPYFLSVNNLVFFTGSELYNKAKYDNVIKKEKDSAYDLNYWDRFKHIKLKRKNEYLVLILNLMRGVVTKSRFGILPNFLINFLLRKGLVRFNLRHKSLTYLIGSLVGIYDSFRENIMKPIYHSLPTNFKTYYDKVRYKI